MTDVLYKREWCFPYQEEEEQAKDDISGLPNAKKMRDDDGLEYLLDPDYDGYDIGHGELGPLAKGGFCPLKSLLFTDSRNHLIRCSNGNKIDADILDGKLVLIVGFYIPVLKDDHVARFCRNLIETYREFRKNKEAVDFEVVMVARLRLDGCSSYPSDVAQNAAQDFFSAFPWLAVPFSDTASSTRVFQALEITNYHSPSGVLVNKEGKVLRIGKPNFLYYFGTNSYPFTDERLHELCRTEDEARKQTNLESLLGCLGIFSIPRIGSGEEVLVSQLSSSKIVGLYLCCDQTSLQRIFEAYQVCKPLGFEVVLVYQPFTGWGDWQSFQKCIENELKFHKLTDLLVLAFCEKLCRKLWRIYGCPVKDMMPVIGPNGSFYDWHAKKVLKHFGPSSFPFTKASLWKKVVDRLSKVTPKFLLQSKKSVRPGGLSVHREPVAVSTLEKKNLIFVLDYVSGSSKGRIWMRMLDWYREIREKDPEFEVVFVCLDEEEDSAASFDDECRKMPWLYVPYDRKYTKSVIANGLIFSDYWVPTLIAVREDGIHSVCAHYYDLPASYSDIFSTKRFILSEIARELQSRHNCFLYEPALSEWA